MRRVLFLSLLAILAISCRNASMPQDSLTRVIVARNIVSANDTILARMGLELKRADSLISADSHKEPITPKEQVKPKEDPKKTIAPDKKAEPKKEAKTAPINKTPSKPTSEPSKTQVEDAKVYHVIVASLQIGEEQAAQKIVEKLKSESSDAKIIIASGRARVAYASYSSMTEATAARDKLAQTQPKYKDAWVLKKK